MMEQCLPISPKLQKAVKQLTEAIDDILLGDKPDAVEVLISQEIMKLRTRIIETGSHSGFDRIRKKLDIMKGQEMD
jgi:hypothetical protein